jgi:hypothetical protein
MTGKIGQFKNLLWPATPRPFQHPVYRRIWFTGILQLLSGDVGILGSKNGCLNYEQQVVSLEFSDIFCDWMYVGLIRC